MISPIVDVLILAAIALFVLTRLYIALGQDDGDHQAPQDRAPLKRAETPRPEPAEKTGSLNPHLDRPMFTGPAAASLEEIYEADNSFAPGTFIRGARSAYQVIVSAFAKGDRDALRPLLDDDVYEAWDAAIAERDASGTAPFNLLRIRKAEIEDAELDGKMARVMMRYEADLGDGEKTRIAREIWTFMRDTTSTDPNWLLDDVEVAN